MNSTPDVTWDLSDLYSGIDDERIEANLNTQMQRSEDFASRYRGIVDQPELDAATLRQAIEEYESILQELDKPMAYASLRFAGNTSDPEVGAFLQSMRERTTQISVKLLFFELELMAIPEAKMAELLHGTELDKYRHFIWASRLFRDYRLSEPEERILEEKANTGKRAFSRLFEETVSNITFVYEKDGKTENLTMSEVLARFRDPDREVRKAAAASLTHGLVANSRVLTLTFNTLLQDKATDDRLRDYSFPEQSRHLSNELEPEVVELVVRTAVENYDLVSRFYKLKREILGYDKLMHYDRYAPLFSTKETVSFEKAKEIVLGSFGRFSPTMAESASLFFDKRWIDAQVRKGKRGGAFCAYITPDLHPYVLLNYLSRIDDVMTLGHELGHGVHACVAQHQGYLSFSSVLPLAELASTFGEMLVFESLQAESTPESRLALYAEKIESMFATIFRQAAMYRFEQGIHTQRREKGELSTEDFSAIWQEQLQAMFGDSLELGEEHRFWWMYVSHFIGSPFYVYAYTFGELLVMALYAMYKKEGDAFPPKYLEMLSAGGSMSPSDLLGKVGIDIRDPEFWQGGMKVLSGFIDKFEELYRVYRG